MKYALFASAMGDSVLELKEVPENVRWASLINSDWFEIVHPVHLPNGYSMLVDEEGLLNEKPLNFLASLLYGTHEHGAPIVGDIIIVKDVFTDDGADLDGMPMEEATALKTRIFAFILSGT